MKIVRPQLTEDQENRALEQLTDRYSYALEKHGRDVFVSTHEISGTLREEYLEFDEATRTNDVEKIRTELLDIATVCLFAIASIEHDLEIGRHAGKEVGE